MKWFIFLSALFLAACSSHHRDEASKQALGGSMDAADRLHLSQVLENSPLGTSTDWQNEGNGLMYNLTPLKNVSRNGNPYCREYQLVVTHDGQVQQASGTACRQANGGWEMEEA